MRPTLATKEPATGLLEPSEFVWALGSVCVLHQRNFSVDLLVTFPPVRSSPLRNFIPSTSTQNQLRKKNHAHPTQSLPIITQSNCGCCCSHCHAAYQRLRHPHGCCVHH